MALFGYTNPDIVNRYPKEKADDGTSIHNFSWIKSMENFEETKNKSIGYPKLSIQDIPNQFNEPTVSDAAQQVHPVSFLLNGFYNGLSDDRKEYLYGQQVYIPEAYPDHYHNTNKFSPAYLAEMRKKDNEDE